MTSLTLCFLLLKCQMIVCPSSLHSCVQGTNFFPPSEPPGEIMSFGVSPVNYSDSDSSSGSQRIREVNLMLTNINWKGPN